MSDLKQVSIVSSLLGETAGRQFSTGLEEARFAKAKLAPKALVAQYGKPGADHARLRSQASDAGYEAYEKTKGNPSRIKVANGAHPLDIAFAAGFNEDIPKTK